MCWSCGVQWSRGSVGPLVKGTLHLGKWKKPVMDSLILEKENSEINLQCYFLELLLQHLNFNANTMNAMNTMNTMNAQLSIQATIMTKILMQIP